MGNLRLDLDRRTLISPENQWHVSKNLFRLLMAFLESNGSILTEDALAERVWTTRRSKANLHVHICMLRRLLAEADPGHEYIVTLYKRGYIFNTPSARPLSDRRNHVETPADTAAPSEAIAHCVDGYCFLEQPHDGALRLSHEAFAKAVEADANHAPAYIGLARSYIYRGYYGDLPAPIAVAHARMNYGRALQHGADEVESLTVAADIALFYEWDRRLAHRRITAALARDRYSVPARATWIRLSVAVGDDDGALSECHDAVTQLPQVRTLRLLLCEVLLMRGDVGPAIDELNRVLRVEGDHSIARLLLAQAYTMAAEPLKAVALLRRSSSKTSLRELPWLGCAYAAAGQTAAARDTYEHVKRKRADEHISPLAFAALSAALGDADLAGRMLRRAFDEREPAALFSRCAPARHWFGQLLHGLADDESLRRVRGRERAQSVNDFIDAVHHTRAAMDR